MQGIWLQKKTHKNMIFFFFPETSVMVVKAFELRGSCNISVKYRFKIKPVFHLMFVLILESISNVTVVLVALLRNVAAADCQ